VGGTTFVSSAMCLVLMYCGPHRGGPSLYTMIHREGRPPCRPQYFGANVLRSARRRTLPLQYDSPGGTTSASFAMCLVLMYCGPHRGGPSLYSMIRREGRPPRRPQCLAVGAEADPPPFTQPRDPQPPSSIAHKKSRTLSDAAFL
jgi:hypothetical protein